LNSGRAFLAACGGECAFTIFLAGIGDDSLLAARSFNQPPIKKAVPIYKTETAFQYGYEGI